VRIPEQIRRLAVVAVVVVGGTLLTRFVIIPPSLIAKDLHRASTVNQEVVKPVKFAGSAACQDCHDDVVMKKAKGYHKGLACEGCHGPAAKHIADPMAVKPPAPRDRKFCPVCHSYDASRPTGFPQINATAHNPLKPCITCHDPHDPVPPRTPRECAACHQQIERTKSMSSHALLACTTCHVTPEQHKKSPRSVAPSKPETRDFCAQCHAKDATKVKEAPRVDVSSHGGTYLCWQCHYPHLPEGRT
jgi:decaheme cytochrome c component MtrC/MtrF-like protein